MANNPQSSGGRALRPPLIGSMGSQNVGPAFQFRPMVPGQHGQFMSTSSASQQFHPVGQGILPGQGQPPQFSQPMQQLQTRPLQPGPTTPSSQVFQMPYFQQNMSYASGSQQFQQAGPPSNHGHGFGSPGVPISSSYTFAPSSYGQPQFTMSTASQFQPLSQNHTSVVPVTGQPWLPSGSQGVPVVTPMQPTGQQPSAPAGSVSEVNIPNSSQHTSSDWQEFEAGDGRRYYYNRITRQSCWEKPLELMTPLEGKITTAVYAHCEGGFSFSRYKVFSYPERADASTVWKEFTTAEGRKYYYNKSTKESKWSIPEELKLAREEAEKAANRGSNSEMVDALATPLSSTEQASTTVPSVSTTTSDVASSPVPVTPVINAPLMAVSNNPVENSAAKTEVGISNLTASPAVVPGSMVTPVDLVNTTPTTGSENLATHEVGNSLEGASVQDIEEAKKGMAVAGKINVTPLEDKTVEDEPFVYASKQVAKHAFKALLESANIEADWNWEQAMRVIINDKRYGALKTLGERKQAFNEYLMQRKKLEAEERRLRQRKAKEEFTKMVEESKELRSSMRWSKAITIFEDDERFKAVERAADREDLFKNYLEDLQKKEKIMAQEELRQNRLNYRKFLETCGLIKVDTQWRKVQDHLEDDESGSRLEKIDRLEIFQDYIRDLEKEEDEQRKIKKEQMKQVERKNRDEFRKMMEEHVASGNFTAKTQWRDYCQKVKDSAPYQAVALNLSGSTPKDLFEDVAEKLQRQYDEDKSHIKDVVKSGKISFSSTWTFEDFKAAIPEDIGSPPISDINLQDKVKALKEGINQKFNKLVFDDLLERVREKEEKEAKRCQRLVEDFSDKLNSIKEIIASSNWEESKQLFKGSSEYRSIREESAAREIFEEYVARLQEKAREKERKRDEEKAKKKREREEKEKRKEKDRREKEKEREREREKEKGTEQPKSNEGEVENLDVSDNYRHKEEKKREKDRERKHRKRHHRDAGSDKDEKEDSNKKSRRHGGEDEKEDFKKSLRHGSEDEKEDFKKSRRHGSEDEKEDLKKSRRHGGEDEKEDLKKFRRHGSDRKKSRKHAYTPESDTESRHKRNKRDRRNGSSRNGGHEELEDGELGEDGEIR